MSFLNKGLKHNLHHKHKDCIKNFTLEAETAIKMLPPTDQEPIRYQAAKNIKQILYNQRKPHQTHTDRKEMKTIRDIKKPEFYGSFKYKTMWDPKHNIVGTKEENGMEHAHIETG